MATGKGNKLLGVVIAIAIIVIVLAIVIPAWHSRQVHTRLNTALDATSAAKLVVEEAATIKGVPPAELGEDFHKGTTRIASPYVGEVQYLEGGRIEVHTRDTGAKPDPVLLLTPTQASDGSSILWQCSIEEGATSPSPDGCVAKIDDAAQAASASASAGTAAEAASAGPTQDTTAGEAVPAPAASSVE